MGRNGKQEGIAVFYRYSLKIRLLPLSKYLILYNRIYSLQFKYLIVNENIYKKGT